jgi:glycosyltransferase involved in cell wall biosynthesis
MKTEPHICHITSAHPMLDTRIFHRECVSLKKSGFRVSLLANANGKSDVHMVQDIQIIPLPKPRLTLTRRLVITWLAAGLAAKVRADLYHFHDPELIPAMRWLGRHTKKPVIWDAHESYIHTIRKFYFSRFPRAGARFTNWFDQMELTACQKDFAGVVTITDAMARRYRLHNVPTCLLSNFFDLGDVNYPPDVSHSVKPRLINTGSLFLERGVMEMADAFHILREKLDCQIALWGNFQPPELAEIIRERILKGNSTAKDDVLIGGPFPWRTLVADLIPTGWVGCVLLDPADHSACITHANRLFEYWANGLAVIANRGTETARIVQDVGGGILIDEINPQEIADAFLHLANDRTLAARMGSAGRRAVEEQFNWGRIFPNLLNFYASFGVEALGNRSIAGKQMR